MQATEEHDSLLNQPISIDEINNSSPEFKISLIDIVLFVIEFRRNTEILNSGHFPESWSESVIVPVYKSGPKDNPNNYRGISLVNV